MATPPESPTVELLQRQATSTLVGDAFFLQMSTMCDAFYSITLAETSDLLRDQMMVSFLRHARDWGVLLRVSTRWKGPVCVWMAEGSDHGVGAFVAMMVVERCKGCYMLEVAVSSPTCLWVYLVLFVAVKLELWWWG